MKNFKTLESLTEKIFENSKLNSEAVLNVKGGWKFETTQKTITYWTECGGCWTKHTKVISEIKSAD